ncbi:MAG TPA: ABC transporter permease subunit [Actinomycetes bacterium]|nr:ABC transporter permease subunit [Actinomycetes bacterium]
MVALLAGAWELAARVFVTKVGTSGDPTLPSIEFLSTHSFRRLSDFWTGGLGAPAPSAGGKETYWGAVLAVGQASEASLERVFVGVGIGLVLGLAVGLLTSASRRARAVMAPPMHFLRMVPFLALAPLFEVWFGKTDLGAISFIAYGVSVVMFTGTIGAVSIVPGVFTDRAATNGASRWATYRHVVLPAIVPAMRATVLVAIGLAWTLDVAAEILGTQRGLGVMMDYSLRFSYTGRVIVVAFIFLVYAAVTYYLVQFLTAAMIRWQPHHELAVSQPAAVGDSLPAPPTP